MHDERMAGGMGRREMMRLGAMGIGLGTLRAGGIGRGAGASGGPRIRLGAPVRMKGDDPGELAREHRRLGYRAAYCPKIDPGDGGRVRALEAAFAREGVVIAEVGRWCNLLDRDAARRRENLARVTEGLALADAVGALCCVDIAGSFSESDWFGPHPENLSRRFFDAAVENARAIIDAVKPRRARFCYEMMGWSLPDSAGSYLEMMKAVDRPAFGVHLDPCNLINSPSRFYANTALLEECFEMLGPHIVSCHAKDLSWQVEMSVHFLEVRPGLGKLDYPTYLRRLAALPGAPPLMIEHLKTPEEYDLAREHIFRVGRDLGIAF